jgi:small subunit ribosomal protein S5
MKRNFKPKFEERRKRDEENRKSEQERRLEMWKPKTELGWKVKRDEIASISDILLNNYKIMEPEITEKLMPNLEIEFINIGQSKGKFGGGRRKIAKQTQRITKEGGRMSFSMCAVCGSREGVVGLGFGKASETVPAREKTLRKVKLNLISIRRGAGSWDSFGAGPHTIPFAVTGKCGSCKITFRPAPKGTGLVVESELKKMLELAGIKDIWSNVFGMTKNKINLMKAGFDALKNLSKMKLTEHSKKDRCIKEADKNE